MSNFWKEINHPIFALAPMEDVTDSAFRELTLKISAPGRLGVLFTEFTSVDGMNHPIGRTRVSERLVVSAVEREMLQKTGVKLVAQIWGSRPELFHSVTKYISEEYNFDGIDINMGCPVKNVVKNGACSALIGDPERAKEIVLATKEATSLPVSVKTRTGIREHITEAWMAELLSVRPAAITLHGRTQKMMSEKPADWAELGKASALRRELAPDIPILGNGDVWTYEQGEAYCKEYDLEGVMIGRGIFQNPWFFSPEREAPDKVEKLKTLLDHVEIFDRVWTSTKNFNILKRFFKIYANGFDGAGALRAQLMETKSLDEVRNVLEPFLSSTSMPET